jgi:hypothetical protein
MLTATTAKKIQEIAKKELNIKLGYFWRGEELVFWEIRDEDYLNEV